MTTERTQQEVPASAAESDIVIVDTTPPEVDAAIDAAAAQAKGQSAPSATEPTPSQPSTPAPVQEPVRTEPVQPRERTYSESEWSRMRQSEARQKNEMAQRLRVLEEQNAQAQLESQVEGYRQAALADLQAKGFDEPTAKAHANQSAAERRQAMQYQRQVQQLQAQQYVTQAEGEQASKVALAQLEARDNGLDQDDIRVLLTVSDPVAMQQLAKTLGMAKTAIRTAEKAKLATVPSVRVESGNSANAPANAMEDVYRRIESGNATEEDWRKYARERNS